MGIANFCTFIGTHEHRQTDRAVIIALIYVTRRVGTVGSGVPDSDVLLHPRRGIGSRHHHGSH